MRYEHILRALHGEPWLILESGHDAISSLVYDRLLTSEPIVQREGSDICGNAVELPQMEVIDGVAHIPIGGVIGRGLGAMEKGSGAVDVGDIENEINQAEADKSVRSIIFDIDSPGGMVAGTPELAGRIATMRKPKYAYVNLAASGAYWLASSTDGIFGTPTSEVGGIGVYMPWIDRTKAFEQRGLKVEMIKAGRLKGLGFPGTSLTESQRAYLQERVDEIYGMFTSHVISNRGNISAESMQGQTFMAGNAMKLGLMDGLVENKMALSRMI